MLLLHLAGEYMVATDLGNKIVQCPEGFNHHSMNGSMNVLKPHGSTPFEPKRGQGYAPEKLTVGVSAGAWGPCLEKWIQFQKSWWD